MLSTIADTAVICRCEKITPIMCGKCGGILENECFSKKVDPSLVTWFNELENERRLNPTLMTYCAIDKQFKRSAPIGEVVSEAVGEIGNRMSSMQHVMEDELTKSFQEMINHNQVSAKQLTDAVKEIIKEQSDSVMSQFRLLLESGKTITDTSASLREATGSIQALLASTKISSVKGEIAEIQTIHDLREALWGIEGIRIEPIGGSDATDALVTFHNNEIEVGRVLLEIKARRAWSNEFLTQVRQDMERYNTALAILTAEKLPRTAKGRGFSLDTDKGIIVTITPDLVFLTVSMFYELHATVFRLQKKILDIASMASNKDLLYHVNDNLKCLEDCKRIIDTTRDSSTKIESLATSISSRVQSNNANIACILSGDGV